MINTFENILSDFDAIDVVDFLDHIETIYKTHPAQKSIPKPLRKAEKKILELLRKDFTRIVHFKK